LVFVYLHHVDMASHLFGLGSARFERSLRTVDALAAQVHGAVRSRLGEPSVVVFSDHGMSPAERIVAIPELRRHPAFGSGFCFALDATMVRLWFLRDEPALRDELRSLVAAKLPGWFLSQRDRVRLHVDFQHSLYGEDIFLAEPGTVIFPNFHSYVRPKAMHAYDPTDPDQDGILIASEGVLSDREAPTMVDLAPLCLRLVGLAQEREPVG
jgi:predicted AlkP superfamily pyrophosphatase or phosphodiesterase